MVDEIEYKMEIPNITINPVDISIMIKCYKPYSVEELRKEIDIAYKNLLPHIKKLEEFGFIKIKTFGRGRKKQITTNLNNKHVSAFLCLLTKKTGQTRFKRKKAPINDNEK